MKLGVRESAIALYDGGWRPCDLEELMETYSFTEDMALEVLGAMAELMNDGTLRRGRQ